MEELTIHQKGKSISFHSDKTEKSMQTTLLESLEKRFFSYYYIEKNNLSFLNSKSQIPSGFA